MIDGYLTWFVDANKTNQHQYHFFNVPAPVYQIKYTQAVNNNVANVVDLFNKMLTQKVARFAFNLIDVYQSTKNQSGFSNNDSLRRSPSGPPYAGDYRAPNTHECISKLSLTNCEPSLSRF